ncbi:MAG: YihY/virulence factor BrkB family protein [Clostridia bacterium]|nr:YihY/virulence factor BrkB family protein [Clostridia bacterium]
MEKIKRAYQWCLSQYRTLTEKKFTTVAGTLVFFLILSVVPFTFWLTLLFGKFLVGTEEVLNLEIFSQVKELLLFLQENARNASLQASFILALTSLYSASNFFYHLRASGEIIYNYSPQKRGLSVRFIALLLTLGTMLLIVLFLALFVGMLYLLRRFLPDPFAEIGGYVMLFALGFGICSVLNFYLCPYHVHYRFIIKGSLITTALWVLASVGFSIYLHLSNMDKLYGAITTVVVFLLWSYVMMVCFVVGVVYNERFTRSRRKKKK